ncbi:MAG: hypothetical protein KGI56_10660 [Acidobacteriota bacterium]|nr:hypothetical protein [Acidobacteriota bacterium]
MAMDSSWDNSGLPPQKKGMPTWVKILGGCGIAAALLIGSCVGFAAWGFQKGKAIFQEQGSIAWTKLASYEKQLESDEGVQALYQANPGLARAYPTESDFLKAAQTWRPKLAPIPAQMPNVFQAIKERSFSFNIQKNNQHSRRSAGVRMGSGGGFLVATWENEELVDLEVTAEPMLAPSNP